MSIIGSTSFQSANTIYVAKGEEIFSRPQEGHYQLFTDMQPVTAQGLGLEMMGPSGGVAELMGNRRFGGIREYLKTISVKTYSTDPSLRLPKQAVDGDATGAMAKRLTDFLSTGPWFWDQQATSILLGNPTGVDGVALLSDSHPHGAAGNWDNLTTDALSFTSYAAAKAAMKSLQNEQGIPMRIAPTHLMVGPGLERTAKEIVGADRPLAINASGVEATSGVVAAAVRSNVYQGDVILVINPWMTDSDEWLLMDLSHAGARPLAMGELSAPKAVAVTDPQSENVVQRSEYLYYVEGAAAIGGYIPQVIYGRLD